MSYVCIDEISGITKYYFNTVDNFENHRQDCQNIGGIVITNKDYLNPDKRKFCTNSKKNYYSTRSCDQATLENPTTVFIEEPSISKKPLVFFGTLLLMFYLIISTSLVYLIILILQQILVT